MARTLTHPVPLGFIAPSFSLPDTMSGRHLGLPGLRGEKATVVMFLCNHCPFVVYVLDGILAAARDYIPKGVSFIAISSNDVAGYPQDAPSEMARLAQERDFTFPYLFDETQQVAKAFYAACTPDISVFGRDLRCVYRGQLDASRPGNGIPVTCEDLRRALDDTIAGNDIAWEQRPSLGCNIKWKDGNWPGYL